MLRPLHKGGNQLDLNNHRPISILSSFNKKLFYTNVWLIFGKNIVYVQIMQFGYRQQFSTNLAITYLYETILQNKITITQFAEFFLTLPRLSTALIIKFYLIN